MKLKSFKEKNSYEYKWIILSLLGILALLTELWFNKNSYSISLSIASIFMFIIIGIASNKVSIVEVTIINIIIFTISGFNILTLIQALEVYYILFLYNRNKYRITFNMLYFYGLVGIPILILISYISNSGFELKSIIILLIICVNRIFNGLVAEIALEFIPFKKIINTDRKKSKKGNIGLSMVLTYTLIASIVIPTVIFILFTTVSVEESNIKRATYDLRSYSDNINDKISSWSQEEKNNLKLNNPIQVNRLIDMLKIYSSTSDKNINFYLIDFYNIVIKNEANNNEVKDEFQWLQNGKLRQVDTNVYRWAKDLNNKFIIKNYSKEIVYLYVTDINDSKVVITVSGNDYNNNIIESFINLIKILLPISLLWTVFIIVLKNIIFDSVSQLINITSDLPKKIRDNKKIEFFNTNIEEIDSLIINYKDMVENLSNMVNSVEEANEKLKKSEQMLFKQANYDYLTGLPNRPYFMKCVQETINRVSKSKECYDKKGVAILFLDLDKFKSVNDTLGHSIGDKLLIEVANKMKKIVEYYDEESVMIARLGGDEFVVQLIYSNKNEINKLAKDLISSISEPVVIENNIVNVGVSIGVGLYPEDGSDIESIFIKSDKAMYEAKYLGGNEVKF